MNFYPEWFRKKKEAQIKQLKLLIFGLLILAFIHFFLLGMKKDELKNAQNNLSQELEFNERKLVNNAKLSKELNLLNDQLVNEKILFSRENTQTIIEAISSLLHSNQATNIQLSLINSPSSNQNSINSNSAFDTPILIDATFHASQQNQLNIIKRMIASDYLFSLDKIIIKDSQKAQWLIRVPTRKIDDIAEGNLKALTMSSIFPKTNEIKQPQKVEKKVEISELSQATCTLPNLQGVVYKKNSTESIVFLDNEIYYINQKINCYTLEGISPQKVHLKDNNGQIFELYTNP